MPSDLSFSCRCGNVHGQALGISPTRVCRVNCYCADCRAFLTHVGARHCLEDDGAASLVILLPGRLAFRTGTDALRALFMTPKGVMRWYAACCGTPMGNMTRTGKPRFSSVPRAVFTDAHASQVLGPLTASVNAKDAPVPDRARDDFGNSKLIAKVVIQHVASVLGVAPKTTPYFTNDGVPIQEPYVISDAERAAAYA